jgi:hypothetical protein
MKIINNNNNINNNQCINNEIISIINGMVSISAMAIMAK